MIVDYDIHGRRKIQGLWGIQEKGASVYGFTGTYQAHHSVITSQMFPY
jgi:hypothetical protein